MKLKDACSQKKSYDQPRQRIKKQRHYFANIGPSSQSYDFSSSLVWLWHLDHEESWAQKNSCFWTVVLEKTLESPLESKETQQPILKEISPKYFWKDWCWSWNSNTLATWCEDLIHLKKTQILVKIEGRRSRGWDGWMASLTEWTWVWVSSRSWWWTGNPGVLQSMGSQRVGHNRVTELNWTENKHSVFSLLGCEVTIQSCLTLYIMDFHNGL